MTIAASYPDRPVIRAYMSKKCRRVLGCTGARYKVLYGGRGGSKSWAVADYLLARACQEKLRILCTREIQTSIKDSVHRLLQDRIQALGLSAYFTITQESIRSITGSEFIFKGLRSNINEIKSTEGIDICWVEEATKVSEQSWETLIPTIRKEGSEIIITFNPDEEKDPVFRRFVIAENRPPDTAIEKVGYEDNDCFPAVLEKERLWCQKTDPDAYENIWLGNIKHYSDALILKGKFEVRDFDTPPADQTTFYYGGDFGFAEDALWFGRCFIKDRCLWVCDEVYGTGIEVGELHAAVEKVPGSHLYTIRADSARPDTINFLTQPTVGKDGQVYRGFNIIGADKGPGSVEDGIAFLRGFEKIYIHPRCPGARSNCENYRWKQDRITGDILPIPVDKHNHAIDGLRYALEPFIKKQTSIFDVEGL